MIPYFGSKKSLAKLYPLPVHDTIIEAFSGMANYSQLYYERNVVLYDINRQICGIWRYLIDASPKDVLSLPKVKQIDRIDNYKSLCSAERDIIGFMVSRGNVRPSRSWKITKSHCIYTQNTIKRLSELSRNIKHWKVYNESYTSIEKQTATYFIDPPYQSGGRWYVGCKHFDHEKLVEWIKTLTGQIIVCENTASTWINNVRSKKIPIRKMIGQKHITFEVYKHYII